MIEQPEISIEYKLTYRDFVEGQCLGSRQSVVFLVVGIFARYIATAIAVALSAMSLLLIFSGKWPAARGILPLIVMVWFIPISVWLTWRYSFARLRNTGSRIPQMLFLANQTYFVRQIQDMGELTWLWSATQKVVSNKKVVLILARKGCFIIIPRRYISDAQISLLEEMWRQARKSA